MSIFLSNDDIETKFFQNMWLLFGLLILLFFMFNPDTKELFMNGSGGSNWGCYPKVYKNYGQNDWNKYWRENPDLKTFDKYDPNSPSYSCDQCYYPMKMPFN